MDAGALLAIAKLGAFAFLVRMWWVSRRVAEDARAERAARERAEADAAAATAARTDSNTDDAPPQREAA
ncbi:MAG: hypothetical protein AAFZ09_08550 [Pseudomonadota bacterium]